MTFQLTYSVDMFNLLVPIETTVNPNLPPFFTVSCVNNYQTFLKKPLKINFSARKLGQYVE